MKHTSLQNNGIQARHVERPNEKLVLLLLSTEAIRPHDAKEEALRLIYTEALLSGAGMYDRATFLDKLSFLGSSINITQSGHGMHFSLQTIAQNRKATLALFEIMLTKPRFEQSELKRIKIHLTNVLTLAKEDARGRALHGFTTTLTASVDPLYTHEPNELIGALKTCTCGDLVKLHMALMHGLWTYTTGGDTETTIETQKLLLKLRKKYAFKESLPLTLTKLPRSGPVIKLVDIPSKHNIEFSIGNSVPLTLKHPDYPALLFGISVLALTGGFAGRLMSIVREKEGLTYMIYGQLERLTATREGYWRITTFFNPKDTLTGVTATLREVERIRNDGITDDELKRFKAIIQTRFTLIHDSLFKQVRQKHTNALTGITEAEATELHKRLQALNRNEVNRTLKQYLNTEHIIVSGAGPVASVRKELHKLITKK